MGSAVSGLRSLSRLRGIRPPLAEEAPRRRSFRAVREGVEVFASKARYGPTPLRSGFGGRGSAASGLRSLSRLWVGFRALREGVGCSPPRLALA